jgi:pyridoxine 5'-phosphate synthase PdxJ
MKRLIVWPWVGWAVLVLPRLCYANSQRIHYYPSVPELNAGTAITAMAILGVSIALTVERIRRRL